MYELYVYRNSGDDVPAIIVGPFATEAAAYAVADQKYRDYWCELVKL